MSNFISRFFDKVGDAFTDTWHAIEANPVGVLVTIGAMEFGLPPITSGMLGGASGAAAQGGSLQEIVKGGITGGAVAYIGGQAGMSAAEYGPIAQAAASGAASGAVGALLTGGNLNSSIWNGLVIGTTVGGVKQLMTTQEAASSVPQDVLDAVNNSSDPLGNLIQQMGWTTITNGAIAAANQAVDNYQQQQLAEKAAAVNTNATDARYQQAVSGYSTEDLGQMVYDANQTSDPAGYLAKQLGYGNQGTSTATSEFNPNVANAMDKILNNETYNTYDPSTGMNSEQAAVAAQEAANMSQLQQAGSQLAQSIPPDVAAKAAASSDPFGTLQQEMGWTNPDATQIEATKQALSNVTPAQPVQPTTPQAPTYQPGSYEAAQALQESNPGGYITKSNGQYVYHEPVGPVQPQAPTNEAPTQVAQSPVQPSVPSTTPVAGTWADVKAQEAANPGGYISKSNGQYVYHAPVTPAIPAGTVDVGGGNYMDQQGNIVDVHGNITHAAVQPSAPVTTTATGYTPAQEAQYNQLISQGMSPADAVNQIDTGSATKVDVGGSAGFAGNTSGVVTEYRTPNTDLATQAQIDNGTAQYNAGANAWEVPKVETFKPVIVPPVPATPVTTPTTSVKPVTPTAPVTSAPVAPTVNNPNVPITLPNGSEGTYNTDTGEMKNNDGTPYVFGQVGNTSGAVSAGTSTGTGGTGTSTSTVPVTPQQPLSPPVQEVIPETPKIPEVQAETPTTTTATPTETTPTEPFVPVIVPPVPNTPPAEDTTYGHYTWGSVPHLTGYTGLNPGWMKAVPHYQTTNDAQAQYYWGQHPFQAGTTFDPTLANTLPNAPVVPFGVGHAQTAATPQQILQAMRGVYPLMGTQTVTGPVTP